MIWSGGTYLSVAVAVKVSSSENFLPEGDILNKSSVRELLLEAISETKTKMVSLVTYFAASPQSNTNSCSVGKPQMLLEVALLSSNSCKELALVRLSLTKFINSTFSVKALAAGVG